MMIAMIAPIVSALLELIKAADQRPMLIAAATRWRD